MAKHLGVGYVVEGSVRRAGGRVRITAQLIDADKNHHLWAERYDRDLSDIFALQDEISQAIVAAPRLSRLPACCSCGFQCRPQLSRSMRLASRGPPDMGQFKHRQ